MDKQQIISFIETQLKEGKITKEDLAFIGGEQVIVPQKVFVEDKKQENSKNIINILYIIGALIALIGIVILVVQNWNSLNYFGRVFITLGVSLITYVLGYFLKNPEHNVFSQVMFTASAFLAPVGTGVILYEANIEVTPILASVITLMWAVVYGVALWSTKKNILILLTIIFSTISLYSLASEISSKMYQTDNFFKWLTILTGLSYGLISFSISDNGSKERKSVKNILYGFGTLGILGAFITLGGIFDIVMIALIFASFYASVFLKSRIVLMLSALFLVIHILKITSDYFANSMNWSVALIFAGIIVIGTGYVTFYLNKKFISGKQ